MLMSKNFIYFFYLTLSVLFMMGLKYLNFGLVFSYLSNSGDLLNKFDFSFLIDHESCCFIFMVALVTSMVVLYSEVYMEHYNNKKFFILMVLFFLSMFILSVSNSFIVLMIGWDGLGVTSICLIMFYPNKMTLYNSSLTMMFNRIGDVIMIVILSICILNPNMIFLVDSFNFSLAFFLIMVCSFTKSAQFPLSSWLPAAMSAPTPISAMVHSSTLVTAGIFLMNKFYYYLEFYGISIFLCIISSITFLVGGLMANLEKDFKKVVAFSTMSQISMILYFCSLSFISLSLAHMIFHAFFKTLLFCSTGIYFILKFSDQVLMKFNFFNNINYLSTMFFFSIFSMSGFTFSSSFFSKDLFLEILIMSKLNSNFIVLLIGSLLTILYCCKLMFVSKKSFFNFSYQISKNYSVLFFLFFCIISFFVGKVMKLTLFMESFPIVFKFWVTLISLILILATLLSLKISNNMMLQMGMSVAFMKTMSYSIFNLIILNQMFKNMTFSDHFFFKPSLILMKNFKKSDNFMFKKTIFILIVMILLFMM